MLKTCVVQSPVVIKYRNQLKMAPCLLTKQKCPPSRLLLLAIGFLCSAMLCKGARKSSRREIEVVASNAEFTFCNLKCLLQKITFAMA